MKYKLGYYLHYLKEDIEDSVDNWIDKHQKTVEILSALADWSEKHPFVIPAIVSIITTLVFRSLFK